MLATVSYLTFQLCIPDIRRFFIPNISVVYTRYKTFFYLIFQEWIPDIRHFFT